MVTTHVERTPAPSLQPWVSHFWTSCSTYGPGVHHENVLPSGHMHLVLRLSGPPLRLRASAEHPQSTPVSGPVVGGARSRYYTKELEGQVVSVGAVLRPGAALALFGVSASELAERHTALHDLCGAAADALHNQVAGGANPGDQMDLLAQWLAHRVTGARPLPIRVQQALLALTGPTRIGSLVQNSAISHRSFIAQFRQAAGLAPKQYAQLLRFRQLRDALSGNPLLSLSDLALDAGYSDQSHMAREFRAMAGVTPGCYRILAPRHAAHVPIGTPTR